MAPNGVICVIPAFCPLMKRSWTMDDGRWTTDDGRLDGCPGKEQRFQKWVNHGIRKSIVQSAIETESAIALEDLSGIRQTSNRRIKSLHKWAFYQLKEFVSYKALAAGIPVILVEAAYTSKTCHRCHCIGDRKGKEFSCPSCGWCGDADFSGARNIADLGAVVNQPGGPGLFCLTMAEKIPGLQKAPL